VVKTTMRFLKAKLYFPIALCILLPRCVSVRFGDGETQRNTEVRFTPPANDFKTVDTKTLDREWRHQRDGATISYLSDCFNKSDPSLESIFEGITHEIEDIFVVEKSKTEYAEREALNTIVEGKVDGVLTRFQLFIFKKNHCTYILTYASKADVFGQHQNEFLKFVKGFSPP